MQESKLEALSRALLETIGDNAPYPTGSELAAHKRHAKLRFKYQNLTFANNHTLIEKEKHAS